jgi:hypothetical protein
MLPLGHYLSSHLHQKYLTKHCSPSPFASLGPNLNENKVYIRAFPTSKCNTDQRVLQVLFQPCALVAAAAGASETNKQILDGHRLNPKSTQLHPALQDKGRRIDKVTHIVHEHQIQKLPGQIRSIGGLFLLRELEGGNGEGTVESGWGGDHNLGAGGDDDDLGDDDASQGVHPALIQTPPCCTTPASRCSQRCGSCWRLGGAT